MKLNITVTQKGIIDVDEQAVKDFNSITDEAWEGLSDIERLEVIKDYLKEDMQCTQDDISGDQPQITELSVATAEAAAPEATYPSEG